MSEKLHDKGYKRLLSKKKTFLSLLKDFVKISWVSQLKEEDLILIDTEFILKDFKDKEADIIYLAKIKGEEEISIIFYCLLELQSSVDFTMPFRLLLYMVELMRRVFLNTDEKIREQKEFRLPIIIPIVLYNGTSKWTAVRSFKEYLNGNKYFGLNMIDFQYILLNINQYTDDSLLEISSLMSSIFILDKNQKGKNLVDQFKKILHIFTKLLPDEQIDFKEWLKDVFRSKISQTEYVDELVKNLDKGDEDEMTYALERYLDELIEEKTQNATLKIKKMEQEHKKERLAREKAEQEHKKERLAREKAEQELQILRKMLENKDS